MKFTVDLTYFVKADPEHPADRQMVDSGLAVDVQHSDSNTDDDRQMLHDMLDELLDKVNENPEQNKADRETGLIIKVHN